MGSSTSRRLATLLLIASQGCVTGHLLDEARRYERPLVYQEAALEEDRLLLAYSAVVTDQFGERVGEASERRVAIPLADLARREARASAVRIDRLSGATAPRGRPIPVLADATCTGHDGPAVTLDRTAEGETDLVLCTTSGPLGPLSSTALVQTRMPPWVYLLLPFTAALDAASNPALLLFAPAVILTGD